MFDVGELLGILPVKGNVFTGDAMFCQRDFCPEVIDAGGDYVLVVKDNQPSLAVDIAAGLAYDEQTRRTAAAFPPEGQPPAVPQWGVASSVEKGHGRIEKRTLRLTASLTKHQDWAGLAQGFELRRERTQGGKTTVEVVYGMTSLHKEEADARRLLGLVRGHWGIENGSHYRRDVTMAEDASRTREGSAPEVMAALRNAVIHILCDVVAPSLAAAMRSMNNTLSQALSLLGLPQLE